LIDLIEYIDTQIDGCISDVKLYGLCHQLEDDNGIYPATVALEATAAFPDDNYNVVIYHRLLNGTPEPREDASFGRKVTTQTNQNLRTVILIKIDQDDQSKIDDIINALPDSFDMTGYSFVNVSKQINLIRDRSAIWEDEYGDAYKDKYQVRYHIYALEYELQYIKCPVCV
jgi:hypothetical protein